MNNQKLQSKLLYDEETKIIRFVFNGLIPSKKNSTQRAAVIKNGRTIVVQVPSRNYTQWNNGIKADLIGFANTIRNTLKIPLPITEVKKLTVVFQYGTLHRADNHNKFESIADTLVDAGIISDDSYTVLRETVLSGIYIKNSPGATIDLQL